MNKLGHINLFKLKITIEKAQSYLTKVKLQTVSLSRYKCSCRDRDENSMKATMVDDVNFFPLGKTVVSIIL